MYNTFSVIIIYLYIIHYSIINYNILLFSYQNSFHKEFISLSSFNYIGPQTKNFRRFRPLMMRVYLFTSTKGANDKFLMQFLSISFSRGKGALLTTWCTHLLRVSRPICDLCVCNTSHVGCIQNESDRRAHRCRQIVTRSNTSFMHSHIFRPRRTSARNAMETITSYRTIRFTGKSDVYFAFASAFELQLFPARARSNVPSMHVHSRLCRKLINFRKGKDWNEKSIKALTLRRYKLPTARTLSLENL